MRAHRLSRSARGLWCAAALAAAAWAPGAEPQNTEQTQVQALQDQVDALDLELARVGTGDPGARQHAMQRHWSMLQDHMRSMRQMQGVAALACGDWMLTGPDMMYGGAMGSGVRCPLLDHGTGPRSAEWALPPGVSPGRYQQQMQGHMQGMHARMSAISAERDPSKRHALMRGYYETLYRDMQTMRGMGWMWEATALPDAASNGAKLVADYCGQCHAPPSPALHTGSEWAQVTQRMRAHLADAGTEGADVRVPAEPELDAISDYMQTHAKARPPQRD